MDKSAIEKIQEANTLQALVDDLDRLDTAVPITAVPDNMRIWSLEECMPHAARLRGSFVTINIDAYIDYVTKHELTNSACFINSRKMRARTIFDLGTADKPTAILDLELTAPFKSVLLISSEPQAQIEVADFIEDWADNLEIKTSSGDAIAPTTAIDLFRKITIESARSLNSEVSNFGQSMTVSEKIEAKNAEPIPAKILFKCIPHLGLEERTIELSVSIKTTAEKPKISFVIRKKEQLNEEITEEFAKLISDKLADTGVATHIGDLV